MTREGSASAIEPERMVRFPAHPATLDLATLPEIDLSLVTYKSERWLPAFFASLAGQDYPLGLINLFVIDHSPDAACREAVERELLPLRSGFRSVTIESRPNLGFGAGHNRTLALGHADYVLVSNVDLTFAPDALTALVTAATRDLTAAALEARQKPYEHPKTYNPLTGETDWVSGACVMLRRSAWAAVGGFDQRFFMYGEDVDLSLRLRAAGHALRYCPQAVVWHHAYEEPARLKEAQYLGATLANAYLRLRFGTARDVAVGLAMQAALLVHRAPILHRRRKLLGNYRKLARDWRYFHPLPAGEVIFYKWDYTRHRRGAFVAATEPAGKTLVSIVVRTYPGREPLLLQALRSLQAQTWRPLEVIVVEDGGSEPPAGLDRFPDLDIVYCPAPKRGRSHAGNVGLALAQGAYIGFLDDDDMLFADHAETLAAALLANPDAPAAFAHAWEVETVFAQLGWTPYVESLPRSRMRTGFDRAVFQRANYLPIQSVLFRRSAYERHGGFTETLDALEDWDLWLRLARDGDFVYVDKTTSIYRTPANARARPGRMLALAAAYRAVRARHPDNGALAPWYVTRHGQWLLRFITRHSRLYAIARRIRQFLR